MLSGDNSSSYGDSLRRILEDYLEIDPHSNSAISQLLSPTLLGRYFKRVIYASRDLIFDIDQAADEVLVCSLSLHICMYVSMYLCMYAVRLLLFGLLGLLYRARGGGDSHDIAASSHRSAFISGTVGFYRCCGQRGFFLPLLI